MIQVKGNNKRGSSAAFYTQLVDDGVLSKLSSTLAPSSIATSGTISGGQLNASALTVGTTTVNWGSNLAQIQTYARATDSFLIACIPYNGARSLFCVQTNGFVQCGGIQLDHAPGTTSSGLYMYGTNLNGSNTPVRYDASLVCSGGTLNGTNTGVLAINAKTTAVNGNMVINNPDVMSSGLYMNGTNGSNTTLNNDVSLVCSGGTLNGTNTGALAINAATTTVNGNLAVTSYINLPSTSTIYTTVPGVNCIGYMKEVKNTTAVSMTATTAVTLCSVTLTSGVWMVFGTACFFPTGTSTFVQAGISTTTTSFDDFTQLQQFMNTTGGVLVSVPMKYYCGNGTTLNLVALCAGSAANANVTNYPSTLRAVRIA